MAQAADDLPGRPEAVRARIGFIGAGRVAKGLGWGFTQAGQDVVAVASRSFASAAAMAARIPGCSAFARAQEVVDACELVFITVPDDAIATVCDGLDWHARVAVVHCSGATEVRTLDSAARAGALVGGFHPLQLFGDPDVALAGLRGCTIAIEAEGALLPRLEQLALALGCRSLHLPAGCRARYHAAAHYAAGFVITLLDQAVEIWRSFGIERDATVRALLPLLRGTAASIERSGLAGGLAGTYSRGDLGTLARHLEDLARLGPDVLNLYCELGLRSLSLGMERGAYDAAHAERMRKLLLRAMAADTATR